MRATSSSIVCDSDNVVGSGAEPSKAASERSAAQAARATNMEQHNIKDDNFTEDRAIDVLHKTETTDIPSFFIGTAFVKLEL